MNRRQLLTTTGAVASLGLCAGIVAGVPGCTSAPAAALMQEAIDRYRLASEAYAAAAHANDVVNHPNDETATAFADADAVLGEALDTLLRCRPVDMSEAADRIEFLFNFDGPWHVFHPSEDEVALLLRSMRGATSDTPSEVPTASDGRA